ncbi:DUF1080 domain-containing protein [Luteitalea sp.]|uniref:3-keto-disaccharide hydrolase n=1 Tax=Luteitalea sp. TaxID=2004800 RepID=UPI0025BE3DE6|nr:DUF1080 domain-containing protein [Luteitalea sp.]
MTLSSALSCGLIALLALVAAPHAGAQPQADVIHLFNGKDLSTFYTWLVDDRRNDPDRVFTVVDHVDGAPAIRISGQKYGGITTPDEYETYRLVVEFRWGTVTWKPRAQRARDSGVLIHCQGPDGNTGRTFNGPWMRSIEAQIIEGGIGDFLMVGGTGTDGSRLWPEMTATASQDRDAEWVYDPAGTPRTFRNGDRINWSGRDPDWTDRLGYRGAKEVEKPAGEWNTLEVIVERDRITNVLNGVVVNVGTNPTYTRGKIMIQSEGAEMFVRRVDIYPGAAR